MPPQIKPTPIPQIVEPTPPPPQIGPSTLNHDHDVQQSTECANMKSGLFSWLNYLTGYSKSKKIKQD
jgi:hypothetical protein